MQTKSIIVGLAGTNGAGKDTVGLLLAEKYHYWFISVTDILRAELKRRGLATEREHMRALSAEWRREFGLAVLVDRAIDAFKQQPGDYAGIVMSSMRNPYEADRIHELDGILLWIDADPTVRYERICGNARPGREDDNKTFEQFMAEEQAEMVATTNDAAGLNMQAVKDRADVTLYNDSSDKAQLDTAVAKALHLA